MVPRAVLGINLDIPAAIGRYLNVTLEKPKPRKNVVEEVTPTMQCNERAMFIVSRVRVCLIF